MFKKLSTFLVLIILIALVGCESSNKKIEKKKDEPKIVEKDKKTEESIEELTEEVKEEIVEEPVTEEKKETTKKTEIKISYTSIKTMKQNHEHKLNASASGANINYSSSNTKCVTVDKNGIIKAVWISNKEKCNSTITITATKSGTTKKETLSVTVKEDTTPPTIECSIYKEAKNGVYLQVKKSDDESGLKEECNPYCFMPIYTKTTTHEVYDKAGNVSTCTVDVKKGCPRGYSGYPDHCHTNFRPANMTTGYSKNCTQWHDDTHTIKCNNETITGEEAQAQCHADTCYKTYSYYCTGEGKSKIYDTTCYDYTNEIVYLGEIVN